jgi:histidine phosphotransferase ChpT
MIELRALELLCSRLCHDLISPVGAIRNGIEILEEIEEGGAATGFAGEAVQLINHAAGQADGRLRLFRLAYGQAGREGRSFADARSAAEAWFSTGRTRLDWPAGTVPEGAAQRSGLVKAILNVLVLTDEALTHGGLISVSGAGGATSGEVIVQAEGRPGALSDELRNAFSGATAVPDLTPRSVHAYISGMFLRFYSIDATVEAQPGERLTVRLSW